MTENKSKPKKIKPVKPQNPYIPGEYQGASSPEMAQDGGLPHYSGGNNPGLTPNAGQSN